MEPPRVAQRGREDVLGFAPLVAGAGADWASDPEALQRPAEAWISLEVLHSAPVAQLDRVPGYEPGGREFESLQARQLSRKLLIQK